VNLNSFLFIAGCRCVGLSPTLFLVDLVDVISSRVPFAVLGLIVANESKRPFRVRKDDQSKAKFALKNIILDGFIVLGKNFKFIFTSENTICHVGSSAIFVSRVERF